MTEEKKETIKIEYKPATTIYGAFVNVCAEADNAKRNKTGQVGNQKYKYATLEDVLDILQPLLAQEKLGLAQYVEGDDLVAKLYHESGTSIEMGRYNLGALVDHQKRGSAITYGRRYQLCAIFGITQEDDDAASAGNVKKSDMTTGATPQSVYGTGVEFKKEVERIKAAISRAIEPEHFKILQPLIEKVRTVDEQHATRLEEMVDLRRDEIEAFK